MTIEQPMDNKADRDSIILTQQSLPCTSNLGLLTPFNGKKSIVSNPVFASVNNSGRVRFLDFDTIKPKAHLVGSMALLSRPTPS